MVLVMLKKEKKLKHRFPMRNKRGVDFFGLFGFWFCFLQNLTGRNLEQYWVDSAVSARVL